MWRVGTGSRLIIPPVDGNTDYVVRVTVPSMIGDTQQQHLIKMTLSYHALTIYSLLSVS